LYWLRGRGWLRQIVSGDAQLGIRGLTRSLRADTTRGLARSRLRLLMRAYSRSHWLLACRAERCLVGRQPLGKAGRGVCVDFSAEQSAWEAEATIAEERAFSLGLRLILANHCGRRMVSSNTFRNVPRPVPTGRLHGRVNDAEVRCLWTCFLVAYLMRL
jgi:hypothetical protein